MKILLLTSFFNFLALITYSQVGLEGIIVEKYYISNEEDSLDADENFATYPLHIGSVTYRVYADLLPGYKVIQMFGSQNNPLDIQTTTAFYNDPNYGFSTYQGTSVVNTRKNTTLIDSYLTIGGVANGLLGVLKTEDADGTIGNLEGILTNDDVLAGAPITGTSGVDGLMPGTPILPNILGLTNELDIFDQTAGGAFYTTGGTVAALGGVEGVTSSNHVLLGQFTTDGIFSFKLNLQLATPVEGESQIFVAENPDAEQLTDETLIYTSEIVIPESIGEINGMQSNYSLFPNPCEQIINIQKTSNGSTNTIVRVLDIAGRVVLTLNSSSTLFSIDTSLLPSGLFAVYFESDGNVETKKFIKK